MFDLFLQLVETWSMVISEPTEIDQNYENIT